MRRGVDHGGLFTLGLHSERIVASVHLLLETLSPARDLSPRIGFSTPGEIAPGGTFAQRVILYSQNM